jgi:hypothetical protein
VDDSEIPEIIKEIEAEGGHYMRVPKLPGKYPISTTDREGVTNAENTV